MDLYWRENKPFLLGAAGALLAGMLFYAYLVSPAWAEAAQLRQERESIRMFLAESLQGQGQPTDEIIGRAAEDLRRLEGDVTNLAKDLSLSIPARYTLPKDEKKLNAVFYFDTQLRDVRQEFRRRAPKAGEGVRLPTDENYGFPPQRSEKSAPEYLARLAILHRVVSLALDAGVKEIVAIQALPGAGNDRADEVGPPAGVFLQRRPVEFQVKTNFRGLMALLHGLEQKGNFLALEKLSVTKEEPHSELLTATVSTDGMSINWDGTLKGSAPAQRAAERGGRSFYRRR